MPLDRNRKHGLNRLRWIIADTPRHRAARFISAACIPKGIPTPRFALFESTIACRAANALKGSTGVALRADGLACPGRSN